MKYFDYLISLVQIWQMHILAISQKSAFSLGADFFPLKVLKVTRNFVAFFLYKWLKIIFCSTYKYRMYTRTLVAGPFWDGKQICYIRGRKFSNLNHLRGQLLLYFPVKCPWIKKTLFTLHQKEIKIYFYSTSLEEDSMIQWWCQY